MLVEYGVALKARENALLIRRVLFCILTFAALFVIVSSNRQEFGVVLLSLCLAVISVEDDKRRRLIIMGIEQRLVLEFRDDAGDDYIKQRYFRTESPLARLEPFIWTVLLAGAIYVNAAWVGIKR